MNRFEEVARDMNKLDRVIVKDLSDTKYGEDTAVDEGMPEILVRELLIATKQVLFNGRG